MMTRILAAIVAAILLSFFSAKASEARTVLTGNLIIYASPTGSGDCSTAANACSLQDCYDHAVRDLDPAGFVVACQLADGTYTTGLSATRSLLNGSQFVLSGNWTSPSNVVINPGNNDNAILATGAGVNLLVMNLQLGGSSRSGTKDGIMAGSGALVAATNVVYGYVSGSHNESFEFAEIVIDPPYTVIGGGTAHWHSFQSGLIIVNDGTITCSGSPAFSGFFGGVEQSQLVVVAPTFSGCGGVTGPRFLAHQLGIIFTNGQSMTYFPGSIAGIVDPTTFGLYQ